MKSSSAGSWHAPCLLVLGITTLVFLPVLGNEFVNFDDRELIVDNPLVWKLSRENIAAIFSRQLFTPHYKPLVYLSWMVEIRLFGLNPLVLHLDNLILHLANSALVLLFVLGIANLVGLSKQKGLFVAFFSSLLFGIHPLHVESVAWAAQRKDVLFSLFYLIAGLLYLAYARGGFTRHRFVTVSASFYLLAVLSKAMAITFAVVPFLVDALRRRPRSLHVDKVPFLVVLSIAGVLYGFFVGDETSLRGGEGVGTWLLVANFRLLAFGAHLLVPGRLSVVYPGDELLARIGPGLMILPIVTVFLLLALLRWRKGNELVLFGITFFFVSISPALAMWARGSNFLSDRYTYIPSIGFLMAGSWLVLRAFSEARWRRAAAFLGAVAVVWSIGSFRRCMVWRDSKTLWDDAIAKFPGKIAVAHINRGQYYFENGKYNLAMWDYDRALEIHPRSSIAHKNRGSLLARAGDLEGALREFDIAIKLDPAFSGAYLHRGMTRTLLGRQRLAQEDLEEYLSRMPLDAKGYFWRGLSRQAEGKHRLAIEDFGRAAELDPRQRRFHEAEERSRTALAEGDGRF